MFPPLVATSPKDRQPPRHTAGASAMVCGRHWGASAGGRGNVLPPPPPAPHTLPFPSNL